MSFVVIRMKAIVVMFMGTVKVVFVASCTAVKFVKA